MEDNEFEGVSIISHTNPDKIGIIAENEFEAKRADLKLEIIQGVPLVEPDPKCEDPRYLRTLSDLQSLVSHLSLQNVANRRVIFKMFVGQRDNSSRYLLSTLYETLLVDVKESQIQVVGKLDKPSENLVSWGAGFLMFVSGQAPAFVDFATFTEHEIPGAGTAQLIPTRNVYSSSSHVFYIGNEGIISIDRDLKVRLFEPKPAELTWTTGPVPKKKFQKTGSSEWLGYLDFFYCSKTQSLTCMFFHDWTYFLKRGPKIAAIPFEPDLKLRVQPQFNMLKKMYSDHFLVLGEQERNDYVQFLVLWDATKMQQLDHIKYKVSAEMDLGHAIRLIAPKQGIEPFIVVGHYEVWLFCAYRQRLHRLHVLQKVEGILGGLSYLKDGLWVSGYHFRRSYHFTAVHYIQP